MLDSPKWTPEDEKLIFMPSPNEFICSQFVEKWLSEKPNKYPEELLQIDPQGELFYKLDSEFKNFKGTIAYQIYTKLDDRFLDLEAYLSLNIFKSIFDNYAMSLVYQADLANLKASLQVDQTGILIKCSGFDEKMICFLNQFIGKLKSFIEDEDYQKSYF